jgi:hypothetical protein
MEDGGDGVFYFSVEKGEKKQFFYAVPERYGKRKKIVITAEHTCWSVPITITAIGTTYFQLQ